jgi:hypothetical protein
MTTVITPQLPITGLVQNVRSAALTSTSGAMAYDRRPSDTGHSTSARHCVCGASGRDCAGRQALAPGHRKSLLGKAHTVMAEGGMAAALGNVDDRDNWRVHFADTMRGGQYLNNWRMAELHAKEAPDRVRELEAWGSVFDRTNDGRILQRNFGGHRYPRLAHVATDGPELIRAPGFTVYLASRCTWSTPSSSC